MLWIHCLINIVQALTLSSSFILSETAQYFVLNVLASLLYNSKKWTCPLSMCWWLQPFTGSTIFYTPSQIQEVCSYMQWIIPKVGIHPWDNNLGSPCSSDLEQHLHVSSKHSINWNSGNFNEKPAFFYFFLLTCCIFLNTVLIDEFNAN